MKKVVLCSGVLALFALVAVWPAAAQSEDKLVYADFQNLDNGRPLSKQGGTTVINRYAQNMANAPRFRGLENSEPPSPAGARVKGDDVAAAFEYELRAPNEWAGVNVEVFGHPTKDGKLQPDDVTRFKFITMNIFAKGPQSIRLELISRGHGYDLDGGYPAATFRLTQGFQTYKLKLDSFRQEEWATHVDLKKDILAKLTSVTVGVFCGPCTTSESGTVVIDNIAFEK